MRPRNFLSKIFLWGSMNASLEKVQSFYSRHSMMNRNTRGMID